MAEFWPGERVHTSLAHDLAHKNLFRVILALSPHLLDKWGRLKRFFLLPPNTRARKTFCRIKIENRVGLNHWGVGLCLF